MSLYIYIQCFHLVLKALAPRLKIGQISKDDHFLIQTERTTEGTWFGTYNSKKAAAEQQRSLWILIWRRWWYREDDRGWRNEAGEEGQEEEASFQLGRRLPELQRGWEEHHQEKGTASCASFVFSSIKTIFLQLLEANFNLNATFQSSSEDEEDPKKVK